MWTCMWLLILYSMMPAYFEPSCSIDPSPTHPRSWHCWVQDVVLLWPLRSVASTSEPRTPAQDWSTGGLGSREGKLDWFWCWYDRHACKVTTYKCLHIQWTRDAFFKAFMTSRTLGCHRTIEDWGCSRRKQPPMACVTHSNKQVLRYREPCDQDNHALYGLHFIDYIHQLLIAGSVAESQNNFFTQ